MAFRRSGVRIPLAPPFHHRLHFRLISQTSETWQPRPLPPNPGSRSQLKLSSPVRVASAGMLNSTGWNGNFIVFWTSGQVLLAPLVAKVVIEPAGSRIGPLENLFNRFELLAFGREFAESPKLFFEPGTVIERVIQRIKHRSAVNGDGFVF